MKPATSCVAAASKPKERPLDTLTARTFKCSSCGTPKPLAGSSYGALRGISWRRCAECTARKASNKDTTARAPAGSSATTAKEQS